MFIAEVGTLPTPFSFWVLFTTTEGIRGRKLTFEDIFVLDVLVAERSLGPHVAIETCPVEELAAWSISPGSQLHPAYGRDLVLAYLVLAVLLLLQELLRGVSLGFGTWRSLVLRGRGFFGLFGFQRLLGQQGGSLFQGSYVFHRGCVRVFGLVVEGWRRVCVCHVVHQVAYPNWGRGPLSSSKRADNILVGSSLVLLTSE